MHMLNRLGRLISMANETIEIAKETIPLMINIPFDAIPLDKIGILAHFAKRLSELADGIIFSNETSINELAQNNYEFLDTIRATLFLLSSISETQPIPFIDKNYIALLQIKIDKLIAELNSMSPTDEWTEPQHRKLSDEFSHKKKSDKEFTEPNWIIYGMV